MSLNNQEFSVILVSKNKTIKNGDSSIANAMKPLICFASLFGMQMVRFSKNNIVKVKIHSILLSIFFMFLTVVLIVVIKPDSWRDTRSDLPLHILTKLYGIYDIAEVVYFIFITTFGNSALYVKFFNKLDDIDTHFGTSKPMYTKTRVFSLVVITVPILLVSGTFWLRKFNLPNIGLHFAFFMIILQGTLMIFTVFQIYTKQLILNMLIKKKIGKYLPLQNEFTYRRSLCNYIFELVFMDSKLIQRKVNSHYCWFELMQIYDKIADSIYYFNQIYAGQVFIMFNTWFLCTLLTICRSLSPSVKYSEVFLNDLFMYSSVNARPILLAKMCELFMEERRKTLSILLHGLVNGIDSQYVDQIQTMLDLVNSRKLEVSGKVFTADVATVLDFGGRTISYTVLMIQYFYMRVFSKNYVQ